MISSANFLGLRRCIPMPVSGHRWPRFCINLIRAGPRSNFTQSGPSLNLLMDVFRPNLPAPDPGSGCDLFGPSLAALAGLWHARSDSGRGQPYLALVCFACAHAQCSRQFRLRSAALSEPAPAPLRRHHGGSGGRAPDFQRRWSGRSLGKNQRRRSRSKPLLLCLPACLQIAISIARSRRNKPRSFSSAP